MRIGKQLFHGCIAHLGSDTALHEGLEVGLGGEALHILQRGQWLCRAGVLRLRDAPGEPGYAGSGCLQLGVQRTGVLNIG